MSAPVTVKGWCPTALRPMMSGDGLLVRVHPRDATLTATDVRAIAELARTYGNGFVDLTSRGNLQIRGVREDTFPALIDGLRVQELVARDVADEQAVTVAVSPLAGLDATMAFDPRPLAAALEAGLLADRTLFDLPSKFGFAIDGGGLLPSGDAGADVVLASAPAGVALRLAGSPAAALVARDDAPATALRLACAFLALRDDERRMRALVERIGATPVFAHAGLTCTDASNRDDDKAKTLPLGIFSCGSRLIVGVAAPFGSWPADDLAALASCTAAHRGATVHVTPWRVFLIAGLPDRAAMEAVAAFAARNLIVRADDARLAVAACAGAPACMAATVETRGLAAKLATAIAPGDGIVIHVSGCAKGCAHPRTASRTLIGRNGRFDLVRNGTARDRPVVLGMSADDVTRGQSLRRAS